MLMVLGQSGQLAQELKAICPPDTVFVGRDKVDHLSPDAVARAILDFAPSAVINAAAYTAVDRAESEADAAHTINALSVSAAAKACEELKVPFVHVSTDYVFAGTGSQPYTEDAPIAPINAYGASKAAGEALVAEAGGQYAIIRTSWVYSEFGANFVKTMRRLAAERDSVSVVADQFGRPTYAQDLAEACLFMVDVLARDGSKSGIYHYANHGIITWADLAEEVFRLNELATGKATQLARITSDAFPTPAKRPNWSALSTDKIESLGLVIPDWKSRLALCFSKLSS